MGGQTMLCKFRTAVMMAGAAASALFIAAAPALADQPAKNISDGAAKGQATEGVATPTDGGSCKPGMAVKQEGVGSNIAAGPQPAGGSNAGGADRSKPAHDDWSAPTVAAGPGGGTQSGCPAS